MVPDAYSIRSVDECMDNMASSVIFTSIDLSSAFNVPLSSLLRPFPHLNAGCTNGWAVLPFGMRTSPAVFARFLDNILEGVNAPHNAYVDDILVHSTNMTDHERHVRALLQRLREHHLHFNADKMKIGFLRISALGFLLAPGCVMPRENKLFKLRDHPVPRTKSELRRSFVSWVCLVLHTAVSCATSPILRDPSRAAVATVAPTTQA
jgi:hypothetical protein